MRTRSCNFSTEVAIISCNGKVSLFEKERIAFVNFALLRNGAASYFSEMPVLFPANSAINFRFLRARAVFVPLPCVMQLRVEKFAECSGRFRSPFISTSAQAGERCLEDAIWK